MGKKYNQLKIDERGMIAVLRAEGKSAREIGRELVRSHSTIVRELNWKFEELPKEQVKGQWTQKVYQVDDSPRYEGSATWVHVDGKHYWENTTDAPLPRRESSKRSDYNVLRRTNLHIITNYGWLHEQDNKKIIRNDSTDEILVEEKGYNNYKKVDVKKCQPAVDWWKINRPFWVDVRAVWNEVYTKGENLDFYKKLMEKSFGSHYSN